MNSRARSLVCTKCRVVRWCLRFRGRRQSCCPKLSYGDLKRVWASHWCNRRLDWGSVCRVPCVRVAGEVRRGSYGSSSHLEQALGPGVRRNDTRFGQCAEKRPSSCDAHNRTLEAGAAGQKLASSASHPHGPQAWHTCGTRSQSIPKFASKGSRQLMHCVCRATRRYARVER